MAKDQQGLTLAGSNVSAAAFDRAVADYYGLTGDPVGVLKQALAVDPGFVYWQSGTTIQRLAR